MCYLPVTWEAPFIYFNDDEVAFVSFHSILLLAQHRSARCRAKEKWSAFGTCGTPGQHAVELKCARCPCE